MENIIIADPHKLYRETLEAFICHADKDIFVTGIEDLQGLQSHLKSSVPSLVLIDPDLPGFTKDFLKKETRKHQVVLIMSSCQSSQDFDVEHLHGIFPKSISGKLLVQNIKKIKQGHRCFHGGASFDSPVIDHEKKRNNFQLTPREKEVLSYLTKGATNKDIARALNLQVVTVKLHVRGVCKKLFASNRTQAALIAKESNW